jgi:spermidine synthase
MHYIFGVTIFLGAALLFLVQLLFARMALPLLGGSPAVWNTAMVFFQAALLAGYGYAHLSTKWLGVRRQMMIHAAILLLPLLALPVAIPAGWTQPPTDGNPVLWLLGLLTVAVGAPFVVVSTTSPLLQKWFAASGHRYARDPYFLYAASNAGSMVGLWCYPTVVEPWLRLKTQSWLWSGGYVALVLLTAACGWLAWRGKEPPQTETPATGMNEAPVTAGRRMRWVLLAFAPSSLMMSVTTYLSTDLAPAPLLWVLPLSVYLLTFIFVFARKPPVPHAWMVKALPFVVVPLAIVYAARANQYLLLLAGWYLSLLFVGAMVCHGELAKDRPAAKDLTEFYFWMSLGGVLGGMFNALVAPVAFNSVVEFPLTLGLVCALMPAAEARRNRLLDVALGLSVGVLALYVVPALQRFWTLPVALLLSLKWVMPAAICFTFRKHPLRFGVAVGAVFVAGIWLPGEKSRLLYVERSFFGINRVSMDVSGDYHRLVHGSTLHGVQAVAPERWNEPLGYYHRTSPIGLVFGKLPVAQKENIAVVGLGAGGLAAYGKSGQRWTFYEIDPAVERIARDPDLFSYLTKCPATVGVVLGDARLALAATNAVFDLLVLDAYSSDTVPVHLLTREALRVYLERLKPDGVLAFHISNRFLDLEPVVARLASDAGLACRMLSEKETPNPATSTGKLLSAWVVMSRDPSQIAPLDGWRDLRHRADVGVWTDDYSSVFRVFRW